MLDDRDYMRRTREEATSGRVLRSAWSGFMEHLRWLFRFCRPLPKAMPPPVEHRTADDASSTDEFLKNEVDPILEKISAKGLQSLTPREREVLEAARKKISRA